MHTLWGIISSPIKYGWRLMTFIREFMLNTLVILVIIFVVGLSLQARNTTPGKGALVVDLTGTVVDKPAMNNKFRQLSRKFLNTSSNPLQEQSLFDVVNILRQAKNDTAITGLILSLKDFNWADQASLHYIGKVLHEFRESGKPIYAVGDTYTQEQYFLASYADKIYLTPQGLVDIRGIATNTIYYKTFLEKLKIHSHIFRVGTYKSAVEPFLRDNMSEDAREADSRWIGQLWQNYLATAASNRKITPKKFFPCTQQLLDGRRAAQGNHAQFALNNKWVDELASRSVIEDTLAKVFGVNKYDKLFNGISMYDYQPVMPLQQGGKIAVIFANGVIIDGAEKTGAVGGDTIADQIRDARLNPDIKAIVFRVNSPGGSVTASEVIRSELSATRAAGKPVVVSMGGVAASGGYWVSTPANYIIASESTLTGSIGIFGLIHTVESSLDSIGLHTDGVSTSPLADVSITKTLPSEFSQIMQMNVENGYSSFINLVAESRNKTPEEVDKIGQGHVWIGSDAAKNGLVDQLGDFDDAVRKAAELAQLQEYQIHWYRAEPGLLDLLLTQASASVYAVMPILMQSWLPAPVSQVVDRLKIDSGLGVNWNDPQNRYAFCVSCAQMMNSRGCVGGYSGYIAA
ncbi:signal peptide peptidase SppA [secondary endosymbiont of Ctenarytaina eucalypti]|uniref:Signal peptide peptidase SppA, 67K type n=1 Tax=secondary endosymbiont of Ctenarytaina eucalypti TaxID=1199245 RepID=J3TF30_9ENTR|nr:signal peptide peptidase SppA [secondary endosymbiont of Ctenarytaina eucalypti]AFP84637.1 signal peptide peptidase SppA, 67K type [secondary endosymbiont of Ctenarytaina eucalypti]